MKPIAHYLVQYGQWLISHFHGGPWECAAAVNANLKRWEREYGSTVATEVRNALRQFVKNRKVKA